MGVPAGGPRVRVWEAAWLEWAEGPWWHVGLGTWLSKVTVKTWVFYLKHEVTGSLGDLHPFFKE